MSASAIHQALEILSGATVIKTRDGLAVTTAKGRRFDVATRYGNEAAMLAGCLALADALKARGAVAAALAAPPVATAPNAAPEAAPDATPDALEVLARIFPSNLPKPDDIVMTGGKLSYQPALPAKPAIQQPEAAPAVPAATGVKRRKGRPAK